MLPRISRGQLSVSTTKGLNGAYVYTKATGALHIEGRLYKIPVQKRFYKVPWGFAHTESVKPLGALYTHLVFFLQIWRVFHKTPMGFSELLYVGGFAHQMVFA